MPSAPSSASAAREADGLPHARSCARIRAWTLSLRELQETMGTVADVQPLRDLAVADSLRRVAAFGESAFAAGPPATEDDRKIVLTELAKLRRAGERHRALVASTSERRARVLAAEQSAVALSAACRGDYSRDCAGARGLLPYLPRVDEPDAERWARYLTERKKVSIGGSKVPPLLAAVDAAFEALAKSDGASDGKGKDDAYDAGVAMGKRMGEAATRVVAACAAFPDTAILPIATAPDAATRQAVMRVQVRPGSACAGVLRALGRPEPEFDDTGSGFLVAAPEGYAVVTNHHVIEHASAIQLVHSRFTAPVPVQVRYRNAGLDVAILDVSGPALGGGLSLSADLPSQDQPVLALGHPGYAAEHALTVTTGAVSKPSAPLALRGVSSDYVQHSAVVRPGNSGGPLLDAAGRVVGLNTFYLGARPELSLAVPAPVVRLLLVSSFAMAPRPPSPREGCLALVNAAHRSEVGGLMSEDVELEWTRVRIAAVEANLPANSATPCVAVRSVAAGMLQSLLDEAGGVSSTETCDQAPEAGAAARFEIVTRSGRRLHASMAFSGGRWELTGLR